MIAINIPWIALVLFGVYVVYKVLSRKTPNPPKLSDKLVFQERADGFLNYLEKDS